MVRVELINNGAMIVWSEALIVAIALTSAFLAKPGSGELESKFRRWNLITALWGSANLYLKTAPDHITAIWAARGNAMIFFLTSYAFLDFVLALLPPITEKEKLLMRRLPYPIILILILTATPVMFKDAARGFWGWSAVPNFGFPFYAFAMTWITAKGFIRFYKKYSQLNPIEKNRLQMLLTALSIMGVSMFSNILLAFGIPFPHGTIGIMAGMILASYSILKHRIIDFPYFVGDALVRIIQILCAISAGFAVDKILILADIPENHRLSITIPLLAAAATGILVFRYFPLSGLKKAIFGKLAPQKQILYRQLEEVGNKVANSRQPERWIEEISRVLGGVEAVFVPFEERFPYPCPVIDKEHPLRRSLSKKHRPVYIQAALRPNPCPAFEISPSRAPSDGLALPIFSEYKTIGAVVFGPELSNKLYSVNDVDNLLKLGHNMGERLADDSPAKGFAKVLSLLHGGSVVVDEEPFDSIEDLKASEFFRFYLPELDKSIQIVFVNGERETIVC